MNKIEQIVLDKINTEHMKQLESLESDYQYRVKCFKSYYYNILDTVKELELNDATLFDFFEKTNGNIRVISVSTNYNTTVNLNCGCINNSSPDNSIELKKDKKYKIIFMAIEEADNNTKE